MNIVQQYTLTRKHLVPGSVEQLLATTRISTEVRAGATRG